MKHNNLSRGNVISEQILKEEKNPNKIVGWLLTGPDSNIPPGSLTGSGTLKPTEPELGTLLLSHICEGSHIQPKHDAAELKHPVSWKSCQLHEPQPDLSQVWTYHWEWHHIQLNCSLAGGKTSRTINCILTFPFKQFSEPLLFFILLIVPIILWSWIVQFLKQISKRQSCFFSSLSSPCLGKMIPWNLPLLCIWVWFLGRGINNRSEKSGEQVWKLISGYWSRQDILIQLPEKINSQ